jgi:hypothetical protein
VGKTKPQITPEAFVYFGRHIEEKNVVRQLALGTTGQMPDNLDFASLDGEFGRGFFRFSVCADYHDFILSPERTILLWGAERKPFHAVFEDGETTRAFRPIESRPSFRRRQLTDFEKYAKL